MYVNIMVYTVLASETCMLYAIAMCNLNLKL